MQVVAHADPFVLEEELLERVTAAQADDPLAAVLVLVPTRALARHVSRRLAERRGACLGVDILHHRALALRVLDESAAHAPRIASSAVLGALLERILGELPSGPWSHFLDERPGARRALLASLVDLREAGIAPEEARSLLDDAQGLALFPIYAAYVKRIEEAARVGIADEAGLVAMALPRIAAFAGRYRAVFHHGTYDLIGAHLELLRELDRATALTFLLPCAIEGPAYASALAFARRHLLAPGKKIECARERSGGLLGARLASLFREGSEPPALDGVLLHDVQGVVSEVTLAARHALGAVARGTRPEEIAIVARSLAPYAAALEEVLDGERFPWTSSLRVPLRRDPAVHDLLLLLRVVAEDFPRAPTAELLGSPRLRWSALLPEERTPRGDRAEVWSRRAGILGGLEEWVAGLASWAERAPLASREEEDEEIRRARREERVQDARLLGRALSVLERRVRVRGSASWNEHAEALGRLAQDVFPQAAEPLAEVIEEMRDLAALFPAERVTLAAMLDQLTLAVEESARRLRAEPPAGLHVLDAMQARGMTFERVHLLGFHEGLPRTPRPDPFLPDALRRRMREATGKPLHVHAEGEEEEKLLLASMLGSARHEIRIFWQRADEAGRARTPSLSLREVARVSLGGADLALSLGAARSLAAHPLGKLEGVLLHTGLLSRAEDLLLTSLRAQDPAQAGRALGTSHPTLAARLAMLSATESFAPSELRFDGRVDARHVAATSFSASALETLGKCPLQYCFRHVLHVRELDRELDPFELDAREMGLRVHRALEIVYSALAAERLFEPLFREDIVERARGLLEAAWSEVTRDLELRLGARIPVLWRLRNERWRSSIARFVEEDLERLRERNARPLSFEETRSASVKLAPRSEVELRARFDRVFRLPEGLLVSDYKTGWTQGIDDPKEMLRGRRLQIPIYLLLAGPDATVEILGLGPRHEADEEGEPGKAYLTFAGFARPEQEAGFRETLNVLVSMARSGRFPLAEGEHCRICDYRSACRRTHPPTLEREKNASDVRAYRQVLEKDAEHPLLEQDDPSRARRS